MHGAQPRPKVMPSRGAPHSPAGGLAWILASRWSQPKPPMNTTPMTITRTPSSWVIHWFCEPVMRLPSCPKAPPSSTKITEKPRTNSPMPASMRPRFCFCRSTPVSPVT